MPHGGPAAGEEDGGETGVGHVARVGEAGKGKDEIEEAGRLEVGVGVAEHVGCECEWGSALA